MVILVADVGNLDVDTKLMATVFYYYDNCVSIFFFCSASREH